MKLTLRHLRFIEVIARKRNFARAAKELHISQPALSRAISTLEELLDCRLFDRSRKGVATTVFGEFLLERGKPILRDVNLTERDLDLLQGLEAGRIIIGSGPMSAELSLGKAVAKFSKEHPKINIQISVDRTQELMKRLRNREIDTCIVDTRMIRHSSDILVKHLPRHQGYFCCRINHPLTKKCDLQLADLFSFPLAVMAIPSEMIKNIGFQIGLEIDSLADLPCTVLECDYLKVLFDIITDSQAVGLITSSIHKGSMWQDKLVQLPITFPGMTTHYGLVTLARHTQSLAVQKFHQCMIETEMKYKTTLEEVIKL